MTSKRSVAIAHSDGDRVQENVPAWLHRRRLKRAFLDLYGRRPNFAATAKAIGVSERQAHRWKQSDPWFARRLDDAEVQAADRIVGELFRLAIDKQNTRALIFILKRCDPFFQRRDIQPVVPLTAPAAPIRRAAPSGVPAATVAATAAPSSVLTDDELETFARILEKMGAPLSAFSDAAELARLERLRAARNPLSGGRR